MRAEESANGITNLSEFGSWRDPKEFPALRLDAQAGHGIGSTAQQRHSLEADIDAFLLWQMGKAGTR